MTESFSLFSKVVLTQDFPEQNLQRGATGIIVEHYPMTDQEDGYSIEGFDIPEITLEVRRSQIMPFSQWQKEQTILQKIH
ncbi:MAG: DUF4926 domain-containing protein [Limnothrix sp. RL_2_0]|nr:DUF4926 domain-containing protein [Limnothrix sp. RL_2_0]